MSNMNCMGFALNTKIWDTPDRNGKRDNYLERLVSADCDDDEKANRALQHDIDLMKKRFGSRIRIVRGPADAKKTDRLVAFRVGYHTEYDTYDEDFHFRVRVNGQWYEKCGGWPVRKCGLSSYWNLDGQQHFYNSKTIYFIFK